MIVNLCFLLLLAPLALFSSSYEVIPDEAKVPVLSPSLKEQKMLKIRLSNGLEAVLVSNPTVDMSSANMTVKRGSWSDPEDHPGMAHFVEHMVFLGTEEYPGETDFSRWVQEHGGKMNAYTHSDYTSYMFSSPTGSFEESLKRFAPLFKSPLFREESLERERRAIDQEFAQNFNTEFMRSYYVLKELANPAHPFRRFQAGNHQTLENTHSDDLKTWFAANYSPRLMRLYILSSEPLEKLQAWTQNYFGVIPDKAAPQVTARPPLFLPEQKGHLIGVSSDKNQYILSIFWELSFDFDSNADTKPYDLLCYVLGHEGEGSLTAKLKKDNLIEELGCGAIDLGQDQELLQLQMKLTSKGMSQLDKVIESVFEMISRLKVDPFPSSLFDEYASLQLQKYQLRKGEDAFDWAEKQGPWLFQEPLSTFPERSQLVTRFDSERIQTLAKELTASSALFMLSTPGKKKGEEASLPPSSLSAAWNQLLLKKEEPWMHSQFGTLPLLSSLLTKWDRLPPSPDLSWPRLNRYLAKVSTQTALFSKEDYPEQPSPTNLYVNSQGIIYYAPDPFYALDRSWLRLQLYPKSLKEGSPQKSAFKDLLCKAVEKQINPLAYEALAADCQVVIKPVYGALQVTLDGYSESVEKFFPDLLKALQQFELGEEDFLHHKETLEREYGNKAKLLPVEQSFEYFKGAIFADYALPSQKLKALKSAKYEDFKTFSKDFLTSSFFKGLLIGSLTEEETKELLAYFSEKHDGSFKTSPFPLFCAFPASSTPPCLEIQAPAAGSAMLLALQVPLFTPRNRNYQHILSLALGESFFHHLRTLQQTGYIVQSDSADFYGNSFNYFVVQSDTHLPEELLWRTESFLESYLMKLKTEEIPEDRFNELKSSVQVLLKQPPPSLDAYGELQYKLLFELRDPQWLEKRLKDLEALAYEDFTQFCTHYLGRNTSRRGAFLIKGKMQKPPFCYRSFTSLKAFKQAEQ